MSNDLSLISCPTTDLQISLPVRRNFYQRRDDAFFPNTFAKIAITPYLTKHLVHCLVRKFHAKESRGVRRHGSCHCWRHAGKEGFQASTRV